MVQITDYAVSTRLPSGAVVFVPRPYGVCRVLPGLSLGAGVCPPLFLFAKVLERLGIANEMQSKTVFPNPKTPAAVGVVVANGEAEIGVHIVQEVISVAGIEIVGPLPGDLQDTIVVAAAITGGAESAEAATAVVDFLRTLEAAAVIKAKGMEPAAP